jgi:hypothetical protein
VLYRAHLVAGVGLGAAIALGAHGAETVRQPQDLAALVGLTAVFALLPDLDTASIIQRWCYRCMLVVLIALMATGQGDRAAFLGAMSLLPLIHRHRGWMHAWWAVIAVPLATLLMWDGYWIAFGSRGANPTATLAGLGAEVMARWADLHGPRAPFALAMVAGYALHLAVDFLVPSWLRWGKAL